MKDSGAQSIYLKDYTSLDYKIETIDLEIHLDETKTLVHSKLDITQKNNGPLVLNGESIELLELKLNGEALESVDYELDEHKLIINKELPKSFTLEVKNSLNPSTNTLLEGLYKSGNIYCTQNEPEGFRRITYFIDRPDNLSIFRTKVIGEKNKLPLLLSNGNLEDSGQMEGGLHYCTWFDPFPKPAYLFALVGGDLGAIKDSYTTMSGRKVELIIYCDKGNEKRVEFAMKALKDSMKWDEDRWGLEYDLDIYMIVAVDAFNMGAMENKGLNIFNTSCVMAHPESATDDDFNKVEAVIGHEYFHNWTGNRVTCRDWFQLTLKEGLTVFRDQEFSADLNSRAVHRIQDVKSLRNRQFVEDAGPNSHPIKPKSYMEINNFYTATVYEKGAEVIRMLHTILSEKGFRAGMDKYFELFDGQAVTTEDFVHAMDIANPNIDLLHFEKWYDLAGTPEVDVSEEYNNGVYLLELKQKNELVIPLKVALFDEDGEKLSLQLIESSETQNHLNEELIIFSKDRETFKFQVGKKPVLSINRNFSAPIKLNYEQNTLELSLLAKYDTDEFNKYEAFQKICIHELERLLKDDKNGLDLRVHESFYDIFSHILNHSQDDLLYLNEILQLPAEGYLHSFQDEIDFARTHKVRNFLKRDLAAKFEGDLHQLYEGLGNSEKFVDRGKRAAKGLLLSYLVSLDKVETHELAKSQFQNTKNMTDAINALNLLCVNNSDLKDELLVDFYNRWNGDKLVIQKWLMMQAHSSEMGDLEKILKLEQDPVYDKTIPNFVRSVWYAFSMNYTNFHCESGRPYKIYCDRIIELDKINPHVASFLAKSFSSIERYPGSLKLKAKAELQRVQKVEGLSKFTQEIVLGTLSNI